MAIAAIYGAADRLGVSLTDGGAQVPRLDWRAFAFNPWTILIGGYLACWAYAVLSR
jgi:hypothetical protein